MTQLESEPEVAQIGVLPTNIPFAIPKKWKWVQLRAIGKIVGGGTPQTSISDYWDNGCIPWFTPSDLGKANGIYIEESGRKITALGLTNSSASMMPEGAVLFSSRAPIGHIALSKVKCCTNQGCKSFVANESYISPMWAYWVLRARTQDIIARASGTTFKEISGRGMADTWIPLPPLEEQMRIVTKIKQLFEQIDRAERAYSELSGPLSERFRQLCLEKAIQGKLVPQLENEPEVTQIGETPEDIPFVIPEKWKWVRLDRLSSIVRGGSPRPIKNFITNAEDGINWIKIGDAERGSPRICRCAERIKPEGIRKSRFVKKGSLLLTNSMSFGFPYILDVDGCIHDGWLAFSDFESYALRNYLYYVFLSPYCKKMFVDKAAGAVVKNLNIDKVKSIWIPLPPLEEQRRIVAKLTELLNVTRQLENSASMS